MAVSCCRNMLNMSCELSFCFAWDEDEWLALTLRRSIDLPHFADLTKKNYDQGQNIFFALFSATINQTIELEIVYT